ncbi:MAG: hypothetical protein ACLTDC_05645 [Lachnospiraceae bacterium]
MRADVWRLYYNTQAFVVKPPTFVIFINDKELTHFSYTRYIENQIRETFGFRGTPLHFIYRGKGSRCLKWQWKSLSVWYWVIFSDVF